MSGPSRLGQFGRTGPIFLAVLLLLTVAAFVYSQRLKREPLVIDRIDFVALGVRPDGVASNLFSPNADCVRDRMGIYFRTTKSDRMDVEIVSGSGRLVQTLATDRFFKRYREHTLIWDGRNQAGRIQQTGRYRVRVKMKDLDRVLVLPGRIRLRDYRPLVSSCSGRGSDRTGGQA